MSVLLSEVGLRKKYRITKVQNSPIRPRLLEMGILVGTKVEVIRRSPFNDPIEILVGGDFFIGLRKKEAENIEVQLSN